MSGHQLFNIDNFRETGRPLLSVLADPNSIFVSGLLKFKRRSLYNNIVNDRSAVYYTTGIHKTDPYTNLDTIKPNYVQGYENVILDPINPIAPRPQTPVSLTLAERGAVWVKRLPFIFALAFFVPIGLVGYLLTSVVEVFRSSNRIKLHENGEGGVTIEDYRFPVLMEGIREEVEYAFETLNSSQKPAYLGSVSDDEGDSSLEIEQRTRMARERRMSVPSHPTLALTPNQFEMIESLDKLNWRKYAVWIHEHRHAHAAIIVRFEKKGFDEGYVVLKHFVEEEFVL